MVGEGSGAGGAGGAESSVNTHEMGNLPVFWSAKNAKSAGDMSTSP